jgi:hypothetical protein
MSNYSLAIRMYPEPVQTLSYADISGSYVLLGTLANPSVQTIIQNWTDQPVMLSWNGINDHFPIASGCAWDSDNVSNKGKSDGLWQSQRQSYWVRLIGGTSPTMNAVYLTTFYGQGV